jgi:hypothetical protein
MTEPNARPVSQMPPITVAANLMQTPAGPLAGIVFSVGTVQFTLLVDDNQAGELAQILPRILTEAAATVRRARLGLIVPGNGSVPPMSDLRGEHERP